MIIAYSCDSTNSHVYPFYIRYPCDAWTSFFIVPGTIDPVTLEVISDLTGEPMRE